MKKNNLNRQQEQGPSQQSGYKHEPRGEQRKEQKFNQPGENSVKKDDVSKYQDRDQSRKSEYKNPRDEQRKEQKLSPKTNYSQKQDSTPEKNRKY